MKRLFLISSLLMSCVVVPVAHADVATAARVLGVLAQLQQSAGDDVILVAPEPLAGNEGRYLSPYRADGALTEWAERAMTARAGGAAGRAAGRRAGGMLAGRVSGVGGFLGNRVTEASGAAAAAQVLGGWDVIKAQSDLSFATVDDMALFLHANYAGTDGFDRALGASMELYPDLKTGYEPAIRRAILTQRRIAATR